MAGSQGEGPLAGLRVLDFSRGRAGALAGLILADGGADVLRIEPPGGDPLWDDLPGYPVWHRGKEIVEIDLRQPSAREAIAKRLPVTDVLIDGLRPGALEAAGLGFGAVAAVAPRLVYASLSGFGFVGPEKEIPGYELLVQARLGIPSFQGAPHGRPALCTFPAGSFGAGLLAVIGVLAALHQRERTGRGQRVETSLVDGWLAHLVMNLVHEVDGAPAAPPVSGNAPTLGLYRCGDGGFIQIHLGARGALDRFFAATGLARDEFVHEGTGRHFAGDPEGAERFRAAVSRVFGERSRDEWVRVLTQADVPVAACLAPGEALDHPQSEALGMKVELRDPMLGAIACVGSPIRFEGSPAPVRAAALQRGMPRNPEAALRHTGWLTAEEVAAAEPPRLGERHVAVSPAGPAAPAEREERTEGGREAPLAGLRVLDFGMFAAGPYAAMLLAELGADVIKIEPPGGDTMRPNARPFSGLHRGKRGLALDLKCPSAAAVVERLVGSADVLLHNFRPGVAERLGLGWERLGSRHPCLIHFHSTGYGSTGPMAAMPGFDQIYQAFCGMSAAQGGEGQAPEPAAGAPLDCLNALLTAAGVLMALRFRDRSGTGQAAGCAQLAAGLFAMSEVYLTGDGMRDAGRLDAGRLALGEGYRIRSVSDGWLAVCCPDEEALDRLRGVEAEMEAGDRTAEQWLAALDRAGVPATRLRTSFDTDLLSDPLLTAAGRVVEVDDEALGRVRQPGGFLRFSDAALSAARGGPALGEHTREILREIGMGEAEAEALLADGAAAQSREGR